MRLFERQAVMVREHAEIRVVIRPRPEQIVPGLIEPRAVRPVDHVLGEELVAALVLDLEHERVVLGAVVGVVERLRHGILVRRIRLAVRVWRQQRRVFRHVRPEGLVSDAARIAEHEPIERVARGALRLIRNHHADHRIAVLAQFGLGLELEDVGIPGRHVNRE